MACTVISDTGGSCARSTAAAVAGDMTGAVADDEIGWEVSGVGRLGWIWLGITSVEAPPTKYGSHTWLQLKQHDAYRYTRA